MRRQRELSRALPPTLLFRIFLSNAGIFFCGPPIVIFFCRSRSIGKTTFMHHPCTAAVLCFHVCPLLFQSEREIYHLLIKNKGQHTMRAWQGVC